MNKAARKPVVPWLWAFLGAFLGVFAATVFFAPAAWLAALLTFSSQGRVEINEPSGTFWNGSGQLVLSGGAGSRDATTLPGRIHWRLKPTLGLKLRTLIDADCCTKQSINVLFTPRLNSFAAQIEASESTWPAALLTGLGAPFNTIDLQAILKLSSQTINLKLVNKELKISGQAALDVIDASTKLSTLRPVGSYRLSFFGNQVGNQDGKPASLNLETISGSLLLTGSGQYISNRWRFNGEASAAPGFEPALNNFLDILGRRVGPRSIITVS
jgi:general secretion pathway protein N